jgi:hypothetical protein
MERIYASQWAHSMRIHQRKRQLEIERAAKTAARNAAKAAAAATGTTATGTSATGIPVSADSASAASPSPSPLLTAASAPVVSPILTAQVSSSSDASSSPSFSLSSSPASPTAAAAAAAAADTPPALSLPDEFVEIVALPLVFVIDLDGIGLTDLSAMIASFKRVIATMQNYYPQVRALSLLFAIIWFC